MNTITNHLLFATAGAGAMCLASAVAAPLLTVATATMPAIALAISPLQAQIFCGGYELLTVLSKPLTEKVITFLHNSLNINERHMIAGQIRMAVWGIFQGLIFGSLVIGTSTLAPSLSISFGAGIAALTASRVVLGGLSVPALLAWRKAVNLGWIKS
jgi:hypothetical protein